MPDPARIARVRHQAQQFQQPTAVSNLNVHVSRDTSRNGYQIVII
jgi:hypothetical protein